MTSPRQLVWRVEIRAGRDTLTKLLAKKAIGRPYEAVEQQIRTFLTGAAEQVRYTAPAGYQANISRVASHPLWETVQSALTDLPVMQAPTPPEAAALECVRRQRLDMAEKLTFGNLINLLVLDGRSDTEIINDFARQAEKRARRYIESLDEDRRNAKIGKARDRSSLLLGATNSSSAFPDGAENPPLNKS